MNGKLFIPAIAAIFLSACVSTSSETEINNKRLVSSVRFPSVARMEYTLKRGANPDTCDKFGVPVLIKSAAMQKKDHVKLLLKYGADVQISDPDGETALFAAVAGNSFPVVEILLQHGALINANNKDGKTPVMESARLGNLDMLKFLCEKGADLSGKDNSGADITVYAASAEQNGVEILKFLEEKGIHVNFRNSRESLSPFLKALSFQRVATAKYLLDKMPALDSSDEMKEVGKAAAFFAISENEIELVKALVAKGLQLNYKEPFSYRFAKLINVDGVYKLAARTDVIDRGYTPLMYACIYGHPEIVEFLMDSGADPFVESMEGQTASDYAKDAATSQMIERKTKELRKKYLKNKIEQKGLIIEKDKSIKRSTILQ